VLGCQPSYVIALQQKSEESTLTSILDTPNSDFQRELRYPLVAVAPNTNVRLLLVTGKTLDGTES